MTSLEVSSSAPGVSRSSGGNYSQGGSAACAATLILAGGWMGRWHGFEEMSGGLNYNMNGGEIDSPTELNRLVLRSGHFASWPQIPITAGRSSTRRKHVQVFEPHPLSFARRFIKKVMSMAIGRRTVGCRLHLPNWEAKYGGRTPLSGSLNKRPFWIFM